MTLLEPVGSGTHEQETAEFFRRVHAAYDRAASSRDDATRTLAIDGVSVRLHVIGRHLPALFDSAFAHLLAPATRADLTVLSWDAAETGVSPPSPEWRASDQLARGELSRFSGGRFKTAYNPESGVLNVIDLEAGLALQCVRDGSRLPQYEHGAPLRELLAWWMQAHGRQLVHAAAVGRADGGVLLAGRGGSGKSSTAALCLGAGLQLVSDDYCLVRTGGDAAHALSLYTTCKLLGPDGDRLDPDHATRTQHCTRAGKTLFHLRPALMSGGFPLRALLLPRVTGDRLTRLTPVSAARSLRALAPSTLLQLPGSGPGALARMAELVRAVPSYALELGTERASVVETVCSVL